MSLIGRIFANIKKSFQPPPPKVVRNYTVTSVYSSYYETQYTRVKMQEYTTSKDVETWDRIIDATNLPHGIATYDKKGSVFVNFTDGTNVKVADYDLFTGNIRYNFVGAWRPPEASK